MTKKKDVLAVKTEDIITISTKVGAIFLGKDKITDSEFKNLQEEASYLKNTRIWSILTNTLRDQAKKTMFEKSQNWDDMRFGKAMLYNIGVQENIVEILTKTFKPINREISYTNKKVV